MKTMQKKLRHHISETVTLEGDLAIPSSAESIIIFAHGSGSSRFSSRNQYVARRLQDEGLATLLFDLLTSDEERVDSYNMQLRFDIDLLAERLSGATHWVKKQQETENMSIGYFGASTGAAAAVIAENDQGGAAIISFILLIIVVMM